MPSAWVDRPLHGVGAHDFRTRLVAEQVHGVRGVMPQQVIGPGTRLTQRIHVGAPEEIRLHVHLLDRDLAGDDAAMNPLVRGIEAARVADHAHEPRALREVGHGLRIRERVRQRNLHLHVFARVQALQRLRRMQLRRRAREWRPRRPGAPAPRARSVVACGTPYLRATSSVGASWRPTTDTTSTPAMSLHGIEMLLAEGAHACNDHLHGLVMPAAPG